MENIKKKRKIGIVVLGCIVMLVGSIGLLSRGKDANHETFVLAHNENQLPEGFISEKNYQEDMAQIVEPYLEKLRIQNVIETEKDNTLYYEKYIVEDPKAVIVISHGFSEWLEKYNEMIYYFTKSGYSVYIPSHRGHGYSTRTVEDLSMVHIDDFEDYVNDLAQFIKEVVIPQNKDEQIALFAHSMGGGIGTLLLQQYPELIDVAILSSPMIEVKLPGVPTFAGKWLATIASAIGFDESYVITQGPFEGIPDFENSSTQAKGRYTYYFNKRLASTYHQLEGASYNWLQEAIKATEQMVKDAEKISVPTLLFQSELDELVKPEGQNKLTNASENVNMVFVPGAKHDLYFEKDEILVPYLEAVFVFLNNYIE